MLNIFIVFAMSTCIVTKSDGENILAFFPIPSISHQVVFRPFTQELARRGHQVTIVTTDPVFVNESTPPNLKEIDVHDLAYNLWRENILRLFHAPINEIAIIGYRLLNEIFMAELENDEVTKILNEIKFDLVLTESTMATAAVLSHICKAPLIQVSSYGASYDSHYIVGAPDDTMLYHQLFRQKLYNLTFWDEVSEYYNQKIFSRNMYQCDLELDKMLKDHVDDVPSLEKLRNKIEMLFMNISPLWDNRPMPFSVVYMGGLHLNLKNELPKDLQEYMDSSVNGIIYVSFGSNVQLSTLPAEIVQIFLKVFSQMPYDILLKSDIENLDGKSENVKISNWFPQRSILKHPKTKLFISHGGLQSTDEAIDAAVPIIGMPITGDQYINIELISHYGCGLRLDCKDVTETRLMNTINKIISEKSYRNNIIKLRTWSQDHPQTSLDRAVWWTEYVLRHGGAQHLRAPAANMPWAEKQEILFFISIFFELVLYISIITVVTYYLVCKCVKLIKEKLR